MAALSSAVEPVWWPGPADLHGKPRKAGQRLPLVGVPRDVGDWAGGACERDTESCGIEASSRGYCPALPAISTFLSISPSSIEEERQVDDQERDGVMEHRQPTHRIR